MYAGGKKEFTREGTLPEPVLQTAFSREFANVRRCTGTHTPGRSTIALYVRLTHSLTAGQLAVFPSASVEWKTAPVCPMPAPTLSICGLATSYGAK